MAFLGRTTQQDQRRAEAWRAWLQQRHPFAIASLVLGVISLMELGVLLIFGIGGIVLGIIALSQMKQARMAQADHTAETEGDIDAWCTRTEGRGLAWTGITISAVSLVIAGFIYAWSWS